MYINIKILINKYVWSFPCHPKPTVIYFAQYIFSIVFMNHGNFKAREMRGWIFYSMLTTLSKFAKYIKIDLRGKPYWGIVNFESREYLFKEKKNTNY